MSRDGAAARQEVGGSGAGPAAAVAPGAPVTWLELGQMLRVLQGSTSLAVLAGRDRSGRGGTYSFATSTLSRYERAQTPVPLKAAAPLDALYEAGEWWM